MKIVDIIVKSLGNYYLEYGSYPDSNQGLQILVDNEFLRKVPKDPWGNLMIYELINWSSYRLGVLGEDSALGGTGYSADYFNGDDPQAYVQGCKDAGSWKFWR